MLGTIEAVERDLLRTAPRRYRSHEDGVDGLPPGEGVFLPCSFWLVDCYELLGRHDDAHALFQRLVGLGNDVGLLSEEYDPKAERMLGNFPQAFTHLRRTRRSTYAASAVADGATARELIICVRSGGRAAASRTSAPSATRASGRAT